MQELETLHKKIELLLEKYAALQAENKSLKTAIVSHEKTASDHTAQIAQMEQKLQAQASDNHAGAEQVRKQVDAAIGEIDKILGLVNE